MARHHARVRKLTGLSLINNPKPWKTSYIADTHHPGVMTVVGTTYHPTQHEALAAAIYWTDGWAKDENTMPELSFYGASDDLVIIDITGEPSEEFYLGTDDTWTGTIQDTDGNTAQLYASFCKDNPDGWHVAVTDEYGECPWPKHHDTIPNSPEDDPMITLTVPTGIVLQEDQ